MAVGGWNLHATWPGAGLLADLAALVRGAIPSPLELGAPLDVAAALVAGVALVLGLCRLPVGILLYLAAGWCLALVKVQSAGLTVSTARYLLLLLPLVVLPGEWLARGPAVLRVLWVGGASVLLVVLTSAFILGGWVS